MGQVLEFYGNFGLYGVVIGFTIFGFMLGALDAVATVRLTIGDWHGFAFAFVVGTSFLNAGGSLVEVTGSVMATIVLMRLMNGLLEGYQKLVHRRPAPRHALSNRLP